MKNSTMCSRKKTGSLNWKIILCVTMSVCLSALFPVLHVSAERLRVNLPEFIPQPTPTPSSTDRVPAVRVVSKEELQQRSSPPQAVTPPSEREGASALNVTVEAEELQSITEGGLVLTVRLENSGQEDLTITNPLDSIFVQLDERFHRTTFTPPDILRRSEVYSPDKRLRVPYILRKVRVNDRDLSQEEIDAYTILLRRQETLEVEIEIDQLQDIRVKLRQVIPIFPGEYKLSSMMIFVSHERDSHTFQIHPLRDNTHTLSIRLEGEQLSPADQQRFLETIRSNSGNAEQDAAMMTQLAYHPTEAMLPVFLEVLNSERPVDVKRPALQGLSRVKGETGIELYRQYAADPLLPAPLRSDAITLLGEFGNRADGALFQQLYREQNAGLSSAIFWAKRKFFRRFPPQ